MAHTCPTDSSNFFSFLALQAFHGPVDLKIPTTSQSVTFHTMGTKKRGHVLLNLYSCGDEKSIIEIPFVHIESVLLSTGLAVSDRPVVAFHLSEFSAIRLGTTLGTSDKIEHIARGYGDGNDTSYRKLVFVLRPYKDDLYVQLGGADGQNYGNVEALCERFESWVRCIRDRDLLAKQQRQAEKSSSVTKSPSSSKFFIRSTRQDWHRLLSSVHLFENADKSGSIVLCRPPETRPTQAPRLKVAKLYNRSPLAAKELDQMNRSASYTSQQQVHENGSASYSANAGSNVEVATGFSNVPQGHADPMRQGAPNVVPMKSGNFNPANSRSFAESHPVQAGFQPAAGTVPSAQWQVLPSGATVVQLQPVQAQFVAGNVMHATPLHTQPVMVQGQQHTPIVYQLTPAGQQPAMLKQTTPIAPKVDASRLLLVNNSTPSRLPNIATVPQATLAALKRPSRTSVRKKQVETIALDDDDEVCDPNTSMAGDSSQSNENGGEGGNSQEPPEKRQKVDDHIKDDVLLVFPPGESGAVSLHFEDLRVLAHGEMLNDNIIEFYLKYIRAKLVKKEQREKVFVFNTFFYQKLTEKQPSISILNKNHRSSVGRFEWIKRNFSKVKSWTKKVDIFKMDYIVLPINDEMHWYLVIIVKPVSAVVNQRTENVEEARKRGSFRQDPDTYIVVLDSLPDPNDVKRKCVLDILRDYLECELADKHGPDVYLDRTRIGALYPQGVPHQENYVDCGLYLLQFAEAFLTKPPTGRMLKHGVRWKEWYPWFDHSMYFMREKICKRLKGLCKPKAWSRLEAYESQQGRGVSVETSAVMIERARRPRRHSETRLHEPHPKSRKRTHSEPPNIKKCAPPAPRMVP